MHIGKIMVRMACAAAAVAMGASAVHANEAETGQAKLHRTAAATEIGLASAASPAGMEAKTICGKYSVPGYMIKRKVCKTREEWIELGAEFKKKN